MESIQYIFQIFKKNLNFLTVHLGRFCDNKNLFVENGRQKINLIINFLKNEKIWILKALAAEQVKQVKQLLHRNSEALLQRNF